MPILKKCCFCIPLNSGAIILASLLIACGIFSIIDVLFVQEQYTLSYFLVPYHLIMIVVSVYLLIATHLEKANFVVPWLFGHVAGNIIFVTFYFIYQAVSSSQIWHIYVILIVLNLVVEIYFWFCVYAYYQLLLSYWNPDAV